MIATSLVVMSLAATYIPHAGPGHIDPAEVFAPNDSLVFLNNATAPLLGLSAISNVRFYSGIIKHQDKERPIESKHDKDKWSRLRATSIGNPPRRIS